MAAARTSPRGGGRGAGDGRREWEYAGPVSEYTWISILSGWNENLLATNEYSNNWMISGYTGSESQLYRLSCSVWWAGGAQPQQYEYLLYCELLRHYAFQRGPWYVFPWDIGIKKHSWSEYHECCKSQNSRTYELSMVPCFNKFCCISAKLVLSLRSISEHDITTD